MLKVPRLLLVLPILHFLCVFGHGTTFQPPVAPDNVDIALINHTGEGCKPSITSYQPQSNLTNVPIICFEQISCRTRVTYNACMKVLGKISEIGPTTKEWKEIKYRWVDDRQRCMVILRSLDKAAGTFSAMNILNSVDAIFDRCYRLGYGGARALTVSSGPVEGWFVEVKGMSLVHRDEIEDNKKEEMTKRDCERR